MKVLDADSLRRALFSLCQMMAGSRAGTRETAATLLTV